MAYAIFLAIFAVSIIALIIDMIVAEVWGCSNDGIGCIIILVLIVSGVVSIIWSFCGGYKYITEPVYNYVLIEDVGIPEIDTKKKETGKHDIVYVDNDKHVVYINASVYEDGKVEVITHEEAKLEVYHCIPENNSHSVDLFFNRTYNYKVYIPEDYEVVATLE